MQMCEKCREQEATVFIKRVQGKHKSDLRLCEACAREQALGDAWLSGQAIPNDANTMPLDELLLALLSDTPDPDSFAPEEDKWSLQKLAALDHLQSTGEFPADEDLTDDIDEMDDEDDEQSGLEMTPEEIQAALDEMEPHERDAVNQMLEALDEVQEHLEQIMTDHAEAMHEEIDGPIHDPLDVPLDEKSALQTPEDSPLRDGLSEDNFDAARDASTLLGSLLPFHFSSQASEEKSEEVREESEEISDPFADERTDAEREEIAREIEMMEPPDIDLGSGEWGAEVSSSPSQRCPKCRTTWDRMREDGRAGCPICYEAFEESIASTLDRLQSASQHVGKAPRAATRRRRRLEHLRARRDNRLAMLRERLKSAVAASDFEEAAKLRDKIKIVESTIVEPQE